MGHYRAEMVCDRCGNIRCTCQAVPRQPNLKWIVDEDYSTIRVADFDKKYAVRQSRYGPIEGMPLLLRMGKPEFDNEQDACEYALEMMRKSIEYHLAQVERLRKLIETVEHERDQRRSDP